MKNDELPMKASYIYTEQYNLRIEKELKDDIRFLAAAGVEVSDLVRPKLKEIVTIAKRKIETEQAS